MQFNMHPLRIVMRTSDRLLNAFEYKLLHLPFRIICTSYPRFRTIYKPTVNDPAKDVYVTEPGRKNDEDDSFIRILTPKQYKESLQDMKKEVTVWKQEWKDKVQENVDNIFISNQIYKLYSFSEEGTLESWTVLSDADEEIGHSSCSLTRSPDGHALFSGNLSTEVPKDGKTYRSGFCAVNGPRAVKSFNRKSKYDWTTYTHVVFRIRGDGRKYLVNVSTEGTFDVNWFNTYSYPLYTRGGPYWQVTKIPFSKFIFSSKGYVQDTQDPIDLEEVSWIGITLSDDINGPFNLEIDYIGLENVSSHTEEHAYETYNFDNYFYKY